MPLCSSLAIGNRIRPTTMAEPHEFFFAALAPYTSFDDSLRLRLVSRTFRLYCKILGRPPPPFPWLMLPPPPLANTRRSFYGIPSGQVYRYHLPGEASYRCVASGHGWIVLAAVSAPRRLVLVNPITQRRINVEWPYGDQYIDRLHAALTSSPLDLGCLLVIASDDTIAYCYPCPSRAWQGWHALPTRGFRYDAAASDLICVGAMVYLVDYRRMLWRVDLGDPDPRVVRRGTRFMFLDEQGTRRHYLVESLGFVHLVLSDEHHQNVSIYRMDWAGSMWVAADDWRFGVLLLGRGCSAAVPATAAPNLAPGTMLFAHRPRATGVGGGGHVQFWTEVFAAWDGAAAAPPPQPPPQSHGEFNAGDSSWFFPAIDPEGIHDEQ